MHKPLPMLHVLLKFSSFQHYLEVKMHKQSVDCICPLGFVPTWHQLPNWMHPYEHEIPNLNKEQ